MQIRTYSIFIVTDSIAYYFKFIEILLNYVSQIVHIFFSSMQFISAMHCNANNLVEHNLGQYIRELLYIKNL